MCGIAGFCNWPGTREQQQNNLEKMKQRMLHRGPDAGGSYFTEDGQVGLGHRRLSISSGAPPTRRFYWRPLKLMELKRRFRSVRECLRLHFMILKNRCYICFGTASGKSRSIMDL